MTVGAKYSIINLIHNIKKRKESEKNMGMTVTVKLKCHMGWKYAETRPSEEVLKIRMTREEYKDKRVRNQILQEEYEMWLWNEIGDHTYFEEIGMEDNSGN